MLQLTINKLLHLIITQSMLQLTINKFLHLIHILYSCRQVFIAIFRDQDIVLNPDTTNFPVLIQYFGIDVFGMGWIPEIWFNDEPAEIDLHMSCQHRFG